ncbi:TIGR03085 family metal-binding protein [Nocardiopsis aegyptia]|uniref:TIGR03085 family metal-binding protein n=1 Tax=Nocardiopsis aegyptia TaxID=220378 RepID=UPI003671F12D
MVATATAAAAGRTAAGTTRRRFRQAETMSHHARDERHRLAELLAAAGPDAPTLCAGWTTTELAAHLVLREHRMDAAAGIRIPFLAGWTAKVQERYARRPYPWLLSTFRDGPPLLSPFALPGADEGANTVEYYVHAEDVRRAAPDWTTDPDDAAGAAEDVNPGLTEALWGKLSPLARLETGPKSPVGLVLRRPDGRTVQARKGDPSVTVTGEPGELVLFAFGRGARARVGTEGDPEAVARLAEALPLPGQPS